MISLLPYQEPSAANLLRSLREHRIACDASDTGTGKTYVAAWIASHMGANHLVVCPKSVIPVWQHVLREAGFQFPNVINYEKLRAGNTQWGRFNVKKWEWSSLHPDTLLIFDEVHRCKSPTSQNGRILAHSKSFNVLTLSATLAQDPTEMRAIGYLLGLHGYRNFFKWCLANGCWRGPFGGLEFKKKTAQKHLLNLHSQIFPAKGSRIRIADLGDAFPSNLVTADVYAFGNEKAVDAAYTAAETERDRRALAGEPENVGALQMQARAKAEAVKADGLAAMAQDLIEEGNSVVIFTSFRETLMKLCVKLRCDGIYGGQAEFMRQKAIDEFQRDETRAIVVNIQAGGVGISLHDLNGTYPRVSLICPTFHAVDLKQALGRIHRAGAKSKAVQKIVYAAGTIEERICRTVQAKLHNIELLQDGDLDASELKPPLTNAVLLEARDAMMKSAAPTVMINGVPHYDHRLAEKRHLSNDIHSPNEYDLQVADTPLKSVEVNETVSHVNYTKDGSIRNIENETVLAQPLGNAPTVAQCLQAVNEAAVHMGIRRPDVDTSTRRHAPLSPSKLKAKAICPGYINDPSGDSKWADRGTLGHKAVEIEDPSICGDDAGLIAAVKKCIAYKRRLLTTGAQLFQEERLEFLGGESC